MIYLIGSMRNPQIPIVAAQLRAAGFEVFDDWYSPGPEADDYWQAYEKQRGRSYQDALKGAHAQNAFHFDLANLQRADLVVLLMPAGKSAHLELGWMLGRGKRGYILLAAETERYDLMHCFATGVFSNVEDLIVELKKPLVHCIDLDKVRERIEREKA